MSTVLFSAVPCH